MSGPDQSSIRNQLLRAMSPDDFDMLAPHLARTKATHAEVLFEPDAPISTAYFIESGVGSLITISPEGQRAESGLFGRDGFAPVGLALGADRTTSHGTIQVEGDYLGIDADALRAAMAASAGLHGVLLRFAHTLSVQTSYTALSNAVHPIDERLARWLLMCHDRLDGDDIALTHEFMAIMLAVRRPSVTTSLHALEGNGFIRAERGRIVLRDRAGLEEFTADSYGPPEREYERLIGPLR